MALPLAANGNLPTRIWWPRARLRLGQAHAGHLRMAVGAGRNASGVERVRLHPGDVLHADHAFVAGLVREPRRAGHVADGVDAGLRRAAEPVGDDVRLLDLDRGVLQPDALHVADDAGGHQHHVGLDLRAIRLAALQRDRPAGSGAFGLRDAGGRMQHDAVARQAACHLRGDVGVFHRQDAVRHFDHRHVRADRVVEAGELDADRAGAHDQHAPRQRRRRERLAVAPHGLAVGGHCGQLARARAGGEHDVRGRYRARPAIRRGDVQPAFAGEAAVAGEHGHAVLLHQTRHALVELGGHRARARHHRGQVGGRRRHLDAVGGRVPHQPQHVGRAQQRLGRDAAPVQADAAQLRLLHQRGLHAELRGADGGHVAARPAADHDHVKRGIVHVAVLRSASPAGFPAGA